jgi:hypothetical protein
MAWPDYNQYLSEFWGWGNEDLGMLPLLALASNILTGTNPPYAASDFFMWFPAFAGTPIKVTGSLTSGTSTITAVSDLTGLVTGLLVQGNGIPCNSVITNVYSTLNSFEISNSATADGIASLSVFASAVVPMCVLNAYIYLATSSILQVRYQEMWSYAMALYIAHYLTMWCQGQAAGPGGTPGQIATSGLAMGLQISKHVGDVSVSSEPIRSLNDFGTYALTWYGQQLATFAKAIGSGPVWCW